MWKKIVFFAAIICCSYNAMADSYAKQLKDKITKIENRSDIDPDSFAIDIKILENELAKLNTEGIKMSSEKRTTYKAILRGVLATAYNSMLYSNINAFDEETKNKYRELSKSHFNRVLEDMPTLSKQNSKDYEPLIERTGGSSYFGHNMLGVMLDFRLDNDNRLTKAERDSLHLAARRVFQMNGDRNSDAMLRLKELEYMPDGRGNGDKEKQEYCKTLEALLDSTKDITVGQLVSNKLEIAKTIIKESRHVNIRIEENLLADKPFKMQIHSANTPLVQLQVMEYNGEKTYNIKEKHIGRTILRRTYTPTDDEKMKECWAKYLPTRDSLEDAMSLPVGKYLLRATISGDTASVVAQITSLHQIMYKTPDGKSHIKVVDRITGFPLSGIAVLLYHERNKTSKHETFITDKSGEVVVENEKYQTMRAVRDTTLLGTCKEDATDYIYIRSYDYHSEDAQQTLGRIYTDRELYRPGQTVHVSSMIYTLFGDDTKVKTDGKYEVSLRNPNGETVAADTLSPTKMGTMTCDFTLPKGKLGTWFIYLKTLGSNKWDNIEATNIRVEEYKRPTYTVEFAKDTTVYSPEDKIEVALDAKALSGMPVQGANVSLTVEACKQGFWYYRSSGWQWVDNIKGTTNDEGNMLFDIVPAEKETVKNIIANAREKEKMLLRITAEVTDNAGETHKAVTTYLIPLKSVKQEEETKEPEPLQVSKKEIHAGETLDITFTPKHKDAYIIYYVVAGGKIIDSQEKIVNGKMTRSLKCSKQWGDGANIYILYAKEGKIYYYRKTVNVPKPDKKLKLEWHTFRDHLTPGQQETWTLTVKDKNGNPVVGANLLASMYDASLDELSSFDWTFQIPFVSHITSMWFRYTSSTSVNPLMLHYSPAVRNIMPTEFDNLKPFEHAGGNLRFKGGLLYSRNSTLREVTVKAKSANVADYAPLAASAPLQGKIAGLTISENSAELDAEESMRLQGTGEANGENGGMANIKPSIRKNFNETAFFYPNITTDSEGHAQIQFTLPESLTTWKFQGFAHTDDVHYGIISGTAVANKDFMVQPQMPRFVRTNDEVTIQARIQNQSDTHTAGRATMRLLSAADESKVLWKDDQAFYVEKGKTTIVTFNIPDGTLTDDVVCEITANDGVCSDGERNLLPVLQTKEQITENIPFYIEGAGKKEIDLQTLYNNNSETATDRTMEIGYTDNPALDVFRALRATQMPQHDNAPCYAAALYSNTIMLDIANKLAEYNNTLIQNFNKTEARTLAAEASTKLAALQLSDGSWSWFKGMEGSPYITLAVAEHLNRLGTLTDEKAVDMLRNAMNYLDKYMQENYEERKANKWSLTPSEFDLRYLDICKAEQNEMVKTYLSEVVKNMKRTTIYGRAKCAVILQKFGKTKDAVKFAESVKHYLVFKPGFGRYFATDKAYYSWQDYRLPTQLAAMRCLQKVDSKKNSALLPDMQMWLLRQKQTQLWRNPLNAIDAADYLLTYSKEESLRAADTLQVRLGTQLTPITPITPSTHISPITPISPSKSLTVEKRSPGISWGYVRGTFTEEAEKLQNYTTGELSIQQKFYVKQGKEWVETDLSAPLAVGSTLRIRNIIHTDRDMDFVSVKTKQPACLEPVRTLSGYTWFGNRGGYLELHDTETDVFFDWFSRGTTTLDLDYYVTRSGLYHAGITTATCEYAPEFGGYAKTFSINVK